MRRAFLPLLLLFAAIAAAVALIATRPRAAKAPAGKTAPGVEVMRVEPGQHTPTIRAMGRVTPVREVVLQPEVGGRVLFRSPNLVPGGRVKAGEVLVKVDTRDHKASLEAQRAALVAAQMQLESERSAKRVAEREWQGQTERLDSEARRIALRDTQVDQALAQVASAQSQLGTAKRNVKRATIFAPFDAVVLDAPVEVGEVVSSITPLGTLVAVDRYWVQVSVPVAELAFLDIPDVSAPAGGEGARARIMHDAGAGVTIERVGAIERLLSSVEDRGRMAQVLVTIDDPLASGGSKRGAALPLLIGSLVHVELSGRALDGVVSLPRNAVATDDRVWTVADGLLRSVEIEIVRREREAVLVRGVEAGAAIVVTPLPSATDGMKVQVREVAAAEANVARSGDPVEAPAG